MAKGNGIIVSAEPRGKFLEGYVSGTPKPGTVMQIKAGVAPVGGRFTWEPYNRSADGERPQGPLAILLPDELQGKTVSDAYSDGDRCFLYVPIPGEELNVLVYAPGTGTADAQAIGDIYTVDDGTGMLIKTTGTPEIEPFVCLESVSDVTADGTLVHVMYTGY